MLSVCLSGFSVTECLTPGDAGVAAFLILPSVCKQVLVGRSTDLSTFSLVLQLHPHIDLACMFSVVNNVNVREQDAASMSVACFNLCRQIVTALSVLIGWESCHLSHVFLCFFQYLQTLHLQSCDLLDIFGGISFFPLDKMTYLKIQSFVNRVEESLSLIKYTAFLYNDQLIWYRPSA